MMRSGRSPANSHGLTPKQASCWRRPAWALVGFVATQAPNHQGMTVLAVGAAGATCLVIAIVVLLITVRPVHIETVTAEGWSRWAALEPETLRDHMRADLRAERVSFLSRTVVIKFRRLRLAIHLILAGVSLLFAA
ncbi:Pycsar system effector family protein [Streptomyces sp. Amel2xC10]|uniref:Pycsar system effector family protein n=1 Tax=Streptomyces sp. Amel2xC10 TaxID=1305826 RepID=UPI00277B57B7|nr:Pycsar system effector family protein [Streptomyces sp. Amel2xC10]